MLLEYLTRPNAAVAAAEDKDILGFGHVNSLHRVRLHRAPYGIGGEKPQY
jgi:hypothetical protein